MSKTTLPNDAAFLYESGLTKRELFAALCMATRMKEHEPMPVSADVAVAAADALIVRLNQPPSPDAEAGKGGGK
jgi:hypothetical protein